MDSKYSYSYTGNEIYCYPGTDVLRNKKNIRDSKRLMLFERTMTSLRQRELLVKPIAGNFDLRHLQAIHKYLFKDVFEWAGELRKVDIAKLDLFCLSIHIESFSKDIFTKLKKDNYLRGLDRDAFIIKIAELLADINALHPFREGNGRAQREFIRYIAGINGYGLDFSKVSENENIIASHESINGKNAKLEIVISNIIFELDRDQTNKMNDIFKV